MSANNSKSSAYVDTGLLRDHISKLREEKKFVSQLYENVMAMKIVADPTECYKYDSVLRDIEQMIGYFNAMVKELAHIDDGAVQLSYGLRSIIKDSEELTQRIITENFML